MTRSFDTVQTRLKRVDPLELETRARLIGAINGMPLDEGRLEATAIAGTLPDLCWVEFETAYGPSVIGFETLAGLAAAPIVTGAGTALQVVDILQRAEPLIAALERLLGARLEPSGVPARTPDTDSALRVQVRSDAAGGIEHSLVWLPPRGFQAEAVLTRPGAVPASLAGVAIPCSISVPGPAIALARLHGLRRGDIVLVPALRARACHVTVTAPAPVGEVKPCVLIPRATASDSRKTGPSRMTSDTDTPVDAGPDDTARPETPAWSDLAPPVRIVIDHAPLPLDQVAALKPGSVLAFSLEAGDFPVRVMSGTSQIAEGQLVSIGEGYGVLIRSTSGS